MKPWIVASTAALLLTLGCGRGEDAATVDAHDAEVPDDEALQEDSEPAPAGISELSPRFSTTGDVGAAPRRLTVRFDRRVVTADVVGTLDPQTVLTMQPDTAGEWTWSAPDRLQFAPSSGFTPGAALTVSLTQLGSRWGVIGGAPFGHTLEVPALTVLSAKTVARRRAHTEVEVLFSGAVLPEDADLITLSSAGRTLKREVVPSGRSSRLRFRVQTRDLGTGEHTVQVRVRGVRSAAAGMSDVTAPEKDLRVHIDTAVKNMQILSAAVREGQDGHYLDVVCHDEGAGSKNRWYSYVWRRSYHVSDRCLLSNDAVAEVTFDPEVTVSHISEAERGFRVFGAFPSGPLKVTFGAGAYTADGGTLEEPYEAEFNVPLRTARVELVAKQGRYVPRGSWHNLPIRHLNTDNVAVTVRRVPPENLVFWLSHDNERATAHTSNVIARTQVAVRNPVNTLHSSWIDLAALVGEDTQGLFEIHVSPVVDDEDDTELVDTGRRRTASSAAQGTGDTSRIVLTDLHLLAKSEEVPEGGPWTERITAFALRARDNKPVSGVVVDAVRRSGLVMGTCKTRGDGSCVIDLPDADPSAVDTEPPVALIARHGDDLTYLKFADLKAAIAEDRIAGAPWTGAAYTASLYTDRGVYRPGDTVHLGMILRDRAHHAPGDPVPATLSVYDPRRKLLKKTTLTGDDNGAAVLDLPLAAFATTGSYRAQLEVGEAKVGEVRFSVEEFVPERMEVTAEMHRDGQLTGEPGTVEIDARYLFGGSAEGSRVQVACSLQSARFVPEANGQLHYGPVFVGNEGRPTAISLGQPEVTLDAAGHARVPCHGNQEHFKSTGRMTADVSVFEAGSGRATRAAASVLVHPETYYIGLNASADKATPGKDVHVTGQIVDWEGNATEGATEVEVTVYRLDEEYGWWRWSERGEEAYDLHLRRVEEGQTVLTVGPNGRFAYDFRPQSHAAGYLVRATAGNARTDVRMEGTRRRYYWPYGQTQVDRTPRPAKPTALVVTVPPQLEVGARAEAVVEIPFDGRVLMTVETDSLLTHEWVDVQSGPLRWPFTVESFVPNVYVSAFLVKDPSLDSPDGYAPERGFGVASSRLNAEELQLSVRLELPSEVRSNSSLTVQVDLGAAGAGASLTLAAVDEGILSLTDFETPDPIADLLPHRRLGVTTYETVGWAMLMPAGPSSSTGGDGMGAAGRVQAVKPVALWSGQVTADANGAATVVLDVPQYRGALRVMAVAASAQRVGAADARVLVRDPLMLQTTLPRFLTQGDVIQIPVFVTNLSGSDKDIDVSLTAKNLPWPGMPADPDAPSPIAFLGAQHTKIRVANETSQTVVFQARAVAQVGAATFNVKVSSGALVSYEALDVPFSPNGPKTRTGESIALTDGQLDLAPYLADWLPTTERSTLWVTANPYGQAMGHLEHLVRYPYGCLEQTTSSTRPLLFVSRLVPALLPQVRDSGLNKMVMSGVDRVLSMQTPSGGFGYWPGDPSPTDWATAYATHMLLDAKEQQFEVPQDRIDDALDYLERISKHATNTGGFRKYRYSAPYAHYVLAVGGRGNKARISEAIQQMKATASGSDAEALYLLRAALYLAGDRRYEKQLRDLDLTSLDRSRANNWHFYSDLRRRGLMLSTYQDLFGSDDAGGEALAQLVARGLRQRSSRYSTQELVWGITGLGKRVASAPTSGVKLLVDGAARAPDPSASAGGDPVWSLVRASERALSLQVDGVGAGTLFLVVNSEGIKRDATVQTGGEGLALARDYRDAEGSLVDLSRVELGDVVYTQITVRNTGSQRVQNIALVERFGAGFEMENPRLSGSVIPWLDEGQQWAAEHMNMRDDRVELFGTLERNEEKQVTVGLRAVTVGEYQMPPVEAQAMYDPSIWARKLGSKATIVGPWEDFLL